MQLIRLRCRDLSSILKLMQIVSFSEDLRISSDSV